MVTKHAWTASSNKSCSVLAKIHMVTKLDSHIIPIHLSSVLAKIHMVTKLLIGADVPFTCSVLAKIHMVTKQH